jgi:uncharacterized membrane protein YciS (DUF1049 family)
MRLILTIFWIILAFFILWIFSLNVGQTVNIDLFFTKFETVNLVTVTFIAIFIGFLFGLIFFLVQFAKSKKENFHLKKQIKALQVELSRSNNEPIALPKTTEPEKEENNPESVD